jgi:hypothetical protein
MVERHSTSPEIPTDAHGIINLTFFCLHGLRFIPRRSTHMDGPKCLETVDTCRLYSLHGGSSYTPDRAGPFCYMAHAIRPLGHLRLSTNSSTNAAYAICSSQFLHSTRTPRTSSCVRRCPSTPLRRDTFPLTPPYRSDLRLLCWMH